MKARYSADDLELQRLLANCRPIYYIYKLEEYGYFPLPFFGEYKSSEPQVLIFNDHNGAYDEYVTIPISKASTLRMIGWAFEEEEVKRIVAELNEKER